MRFMLCARDRSTGTVTLVSERSFPNRREAVGAISGVRDFSDFIGADIFLVDLDTATPVAVVPWRPEEEPRSEASPAEGPGTVAEPYVELFPESAPLLETEPAVPAGPEAEAAEAQGAPEIEAGPEAGPEPEAPTPEPEPVAWTARPVVLGTVEIDIEAWTCEDCIYISTCPNSGTVRPAECGAFQWRA